MLPPKAREALQLWLEYAETRRTLTARLFAQREDAELLRDLLADNDRRLDQAIALSRELLANDPQPDTKP